MSEDTPKSTSLGTATLDVQTVLQPGITADGKTIAELADEAKGRQLVEIVAGRKYVIVTATGQTLHPIDIDPEEFADTPSAKRGHVDLIDPDSFVTYVDRHAHELGTTLWSDVDAGTVTAVLDDHIRNDQDNKVDGGPGWGRHRAVLTLRQTEDWRHWLHLDGKFVSQDTFAEHIEDGVDAIVNPDAATMLELAQTFHARTGARMESGRRLSGEVQFTYSEETTAGAGRGSIEIPDTITLGLAPFYGNEPYPITARFRFRLADGRLSLGYRLIRPDRVRQQAFDDVIARISAAADFPVMAGTPRDEDD